MSGSKISEVNTLIRSTICRIIKGSLKIKVILLRWLKWYSGLCLKQNK